MALGIHPEGHYTVLSIPLEWDSGEVLANHLRMMANEIEKSGISILNVRLNAPINQPVSKTALEFVGFPPRRDAGG